MVWDMRKLLLLCCRRYRLMRFKNWTSTELAQYAPWEILAANASEVGDAGAAAAEAISAPIVNVTTTTTMVIRDIGLTLPSLVVRCVADIAHDCTARNPT